MGFVYEPFGIGPEEISETFILLPVTGTIGAFVGGYYLKKT